MQEPRDPLLKVLFLLKQKIQTMYFYNQVLVNGLATGNSLAKYYFLPAKGLTTKQDMSSGSNRVDKQWDVKNF